MCDTPDGLVAAAVVTRKMLSFRRPSPPHLNAMQTWLHPAFRVAGMKSALEIAKLISQSEQSCKSLTQVLILMKNAFRWNAVGIEGKGVCDT
jgi:hypothetical protein